MVRSLISASTASGSSSGRRSELMSAKTVLPPLLALLGEDEQAKADRALIERLREVPVLELCAADLDLVDRLITALQAAYHLQPEVRV